MNKDQCLITEHFHFDFTCDIVQLHVVYYFSSLIFWLFFDLDIFLTLTSDVQLVASVPFNIILLQWHCNQSRCALSNRVMELLLYL